MTVGPVCVINCIFPVVNTAFHPTAMLARLLSRTAPLVRVASSPVGARLVAQHNFFNVTLVALPRPAFFAQPPSRLAIAASQRRFASSKVIVPSMGDSISEGTLIDWKIKEGDSVAVDDLLCEIETDKVSIPIRSPVSGKISKILVTDGTTVKVGQHLVDVEAGAAVAKAVPNIAPSASITPALPSASPAAAPKVEAPKPVAAAAAAAAAAPKPASAAPTIAAPTHAIGFSAERTERRVKMTRMRARIAERLKDSQNTAAMLTTFNEIDMSAAMELRTRFKDEFEKKHKVKLGFMSLFVKAATAALQAEPSVNAVIDGGDIVYRDYTDISVAVASPTGLVVPVLRNTHLMSLADIERSIAAYGQKAKDGSLALEDMAGGTFTISNGGVFGSMFGTPIINPPQSAILGMHAIKDRAVVVNGKVEARPVMYVALTYDHRLIDGREAVTFLKKIKQVTSTHP
jgi:2-oxoglutarate dehydrogenase E2 component (dihydrolipoamide succinyltransferase)